MDKEGFFTTIVGSWPLSNKPENMIKVFNDLIEVGIDFPCYPQLISMISQFLSPLAKSVDQLEEENEKFYLTNDFKIPKNPIALEYGEFITKFFNERRSLLEKIKGTKACLTGPLTLASEIILKGEVAQGVKTRVFSEPRAIMVDWIVEKLADVMKQVGKAYNDMGIDIISMDEPLLGVLVGRKPLFHSEDFMVEILNKSISEIKSLSSIHVCGRISPKLRDILLQTDVKILDHEFRTNGKNFEIFQKDHFKDTDKFLALGTVKSLFGPKNGYEVNDYVEKIDFLENYLKNAIKQYGKENLIIKPDCGFLPLKDTFGEKEGYDISISKVKNMVIALNKIR
jgi:methionine synthase II (cobalamin-independent)